MADNKQKTAGESYALTEKIAAAIKKWYWLLLLILSLTATAFYAAARISYTPVYQSYASVTPSVRDSATADVIEEIAKELMTKAEDGSLAAALAETVGENVKTADIRFVADGINLAVSVRASSAELSYETLRAIVTAGVGLLNEERAYELVLVSESGFPHAVTNPLDYDAEIQRGLLAGAAISVIFLLGIALRGKKTVPVGEVEETEPEPVPVKAEPESEPVKAEHETVPEPEPVKTEPVPVPEPVRAEPVHEPVVVKTEPEPAAKEPEETSAPAEQPKTVPGGIPADLARFASVIGASTFEIPAVSKEEVPEEKVPEEEVPEVPQETEAPASAEAEVPEKEVPEKEDSPSEPASLESAAPEPASSEPASPEPAAEEAPKEEKNAGDEEWDPEKTTLSREMWEIAKEMGMLDDFRI